MRSSNTDTKTFRHQGIKASWNTQVRDRLHFEKASEVQLRLFDYSTVPAILTSLLFPVLSPVTPPTQSRSHNHDHTSLYPFNLQPHLVPLLTSLLTLSDVFSRSIKLPKITAKYALILRAHFRQISRARFSSLHHLSPVYRPAVLQGPLRAQTMSSSEDDTPLVKANGRSSGGFPL